MDNEKQTSEDQEKASRIRRELRLLGLPDWMPNPADLLAECADQEQETAS